MHYSLRVVKRSAVLAVALCMFATSGFAQSFIPKGIYRSPFETGQLGTQESGTARWQLITSGGYQNFLEMSEGYLGNAFVFGFDAVYMRSSGFVLWLNNGFNFGGVTVYDSYGYRSLPLLGWTGELLLGYGGYFGRHGLRFGLGFQTSFNSGGMILFGAFATRFEYLYTFNKSTSLSISLNEAFGGGAGLLNSFALKVGAAFNL